MFVRMAGHALYGMAPCFGHTGITFDTENDRPGPGTLRGHFEAARGRGSDKINYVSVSRMFVYLQVLYLSFLLSWLYNFVAFYIAGI